MTKHWMTKKEITEKYGISSAHLDRLCKNGAVDIKFNKRKEGQKGRNPKQLNVKDVRIFHTMDKDARKIVLNATTKHISLRENLDKAVKRKQNNPYQSYPYVAKGKVKIDTTSEHYKKGKQIHDEMVNHPKHYNPGKIEVITAIEDWGLDFNEGNVIKYIVRAKDKNNRMQDLQKALWYINRMIVNLKMKK